MIPLSRPILEDELWWSGIARHAELVGMATLVPRHEGIIGNRRSLGSPLFPRQLNAWIPALGLHATAAEVIARHSMLPLYRPFFHSKKIERAVAAICGNGNAEMALGLAPMEDFPVTLRMCPKCQKQDRACFGVAVWRRSHQASGVLVCYLHGCELLQTSVSCRATQFISLTAADSAGKTEPLSVPHALRKVAAEIAGSMHSLLNSVTANVDQGRLAQLYRLKLRALALVDDFDRLRLKEFTGAFIDRFDAFLKLNGSLVPDATQRDNWLARLVRRPRSEQSPLRHVLLMQFLNLEVTAAIAEAQTLMPYSGRQTKPALAQRRSVRITEAKVEAKRAAWLDLVKASPGGALRAQNDPLYSWLWRNDRAWLADNMKSQ